LDHLQYLSEKSIWGTSSIFAKTIDRIYRVKHPRGRKKQSGKTQFLPGRRCKMSQLVAPAAWRNSAKMGADALPKTEPAPESKTKNSWHTDTI
jgi:hypothetical protein